MCPFSRHYLYHTSLQSWLKIFLGKTASRLAQAPHLWPPMTALRHLINCTSILLSFNFQGRILIQLLLLSTAVPRNLPELEIPPPHIAARKFIPTCGWKFVSRAHPSTTTSGCLNFSLMLHPLSASSGLPSTNLAILGGGMKDHIHLLDKFIHLLDNHTVLLWSATQA